MNLIVFSTLFPKPLSPIAFRTLLDKLPANLQQTVLKFRNWTDAHASLLGKHLLMKAMAAVGFIPDLNQLRYSDYRRPYFDAYPDFNISHSGNRVICVVSPEGQIGIDLEAITPIDFDDFKTQFSPKEWTDILTSQNPLALFYDYWTAKESLIKADGRGLSIPLTSLAISTTEPVLLNGQELFLQKLALSGNYTGHLACTIRPAAIDVVEIDPLSFLQDAY